MVAEVLRRLLFGPGQPLQDRTGESRLSDLEVRMGQVEKRLEEMEARFSEWINVKGYS